MIEEMTDLGMWVNFDDGQRVEVEYISDDNRLRISHYKADSDDVSASAEVCPENADNDRLLKHGIFRPRGILLWTKNDQNQDGPCTTAYFSYETVTLRRADPEYAYVSISACVHCSRLLDVVMR